MRGALFGGASALALACGLGSPTAGLAQSVLLDGVPLAGSPNVVTTVPVGDGQTLTIEQGASVDVPGADAVIDAAAGTTITVDNFGLLRATGADAIDATGSTLLGSNTGTITTTGLAGIRATTIADFTNSGTITGATQGITATTITALTNTGVITGNGDDGILATTITRLTNSGTINGILSDGIDANTIASLVNSGTITGADDGIEANTIANLVNSGTISGVDGLDAGTITSLTNSGTIAGTGLAGVRSTNLADVLNSGTITGNAQGISATTIMALTNTGVITGIGDDGIFATTIASLTNSGTINGIVSDGIDANTITSLVNSGLITGRDNGVDANNLISLVNSGTIIGGTGPAILETGAADTTLTLLAGSNIQGAIDLGGGVNTLIVGNGLSIANTFVGGAPIVVPNGAPFAVNGSRVAFVDPTLEAFQDEILVDLTNGIFGGVSARLNGLAGGIVVGVTRQPSGAQATYKGEYIADLGDRQAWAHAFGAARQQEASGPNVEAEHQFGGLMSGMDAQLSARLRAGFFLGGSWGEAESVLQTQEEDIDTVFGGVYARRDLGNLALDATVSVGHSTHERERQVANNLVAGGLQTAKGSFDGTFVAAGLDLKGNIHVGRRRVTPSVHVRYAGQFLDGFTEAGAAGNLTLSNREVHVLQGRAQLALPYEKQTAGGGFLRAEMKVGVEGRTNIGDDSFGAVLLGQTIAFAPGDEDTVNSFYGGTEIAYTLPNGQVQLTTSVEGGIEDDGSHFVNGRTGAKIIF